VIVLVPSGRSIPVVSALRIGEEKPWLPARARVGRGHVHDEAWVRTLTLCCVHVHAPGRVW
jgi:hypothetical protein